MSVLDDFSLKGRIIAVLGGEGPLGGIAKQIITELDGKAISIDVKSWADYVCNAATNFVRLHQIAHNLAYSGIINCAIRNYRPVTAPIHDDPSTGLATATCTHTVFYALIETTFTIFSFAVCDPFANAPSAKQENEACEPPSAEQR